MEQVVPIVDAFMKALVDNIVSWSLKDWVAPLALLVSIIALFVSIKNARIQQEKLELDRRNAELSRQAQKLHIYVADRICYIEPLKDSEIKATGQIIFDWHRLRFITIPGGTEKFIKITLSLSNSDREDIYLKQFKYVVCWRGFNHGVTQYYQTYHYPDESIRLERRSEQEQIMFSPWYKIMPGEKSLWDVYITLYRSETETRKYYLESIYFEMDGDKSTYDITVDFDQNKSPWIVNWTFIEDNNRDELARAFPTG